MSCTFRRLIYKYRQLKCSNGTLLNSMQIGFLTGLGDVLAQKYLEEQCEIDWLRTAKATAFGAFFVGPATSWWFRFAERKFACKPCKECSKFTMALKQILATELIFVPIVNAAGLTVMSTIDGKCYGGIVQTVNEKWGDIVVANWTYWPLIHFIKYMVLIPRHQLLIFKLAYVPWAAYLSWKYHLDECEACCEECEDDDE
ncbi:unnamed protein product [Brassicogethes aeneus]|uniref:Mitochondrial inner membrane protein Mpv17 n=1 Tax=Brassicogethes aeneus TaxID=1431903 RepID=A0A9P0B910_BRAAE|nr:unnamed protein product [Brassicogethes aeneus]